MGNVIFLGTSTPVVKTITLEQYGSTSATMSHNESGKLVLVSWHAHWKQVGGGVSMSSAVYLGNTTILNYSSSIGDSNGAWGWQVSSVLDYVANTVVTATSNNPADRWRMGCTMVVVPE